MKPEEIEKLSLDELLRIADDPQITVPDGLADRLQDIASSALLAARGPEALDDQPRPTQAFGHPARWLWGAIPAVALASLAIALLGGHPQPLTPEAEAAYTELERTFLSFSEALQSGYETFSTPYTDNPNIPSI